MITEVFLLVTGISQRVIFSVCMVLYF